MTITELFITSNETEQKVVEQIADHQWELMMPEKITRTPMSLMEVYATMYGTVLGYPMV